MSNEELLILVNLTDDLQSFALSAVEIFLLTIIAEGMVGFILFETIFYIYILNSVYLYRI